MDSNPISLTDSVLDGRVMGTLTFSGGGVVEPDGWLSESESDGATIAGLLMRAPKEWILLTDALADLNNEMKSAHTDCGLRWRDQADMARDPSTVTAEGHSALGLYAGIVERLNAQDLDDLRESGASIGASTVNEVHPAVLMFHGVEDSWEYLYDAGTGRGWAAEGVPTFTGLALVHWRARSQEGSIRFRLNEMTPVLHHHVVGPLDLAPLTAVPSYQGLSDAESVLRACIIQQVAQQIEWPAEWDDATKDEAVGAIRTLHRPWLHTLHTADADSEVARETLARLLDPYLPGLNSIGAVPVLPPPRLVKNAHQAEVYAGEVMEALGFTEVRVALPGPDGGVDVWAREAVAQVKMEGVSTGRPVVQALHGIASLEGRAGLLFSLAGYTSAAVAWAEKAGIALFEFELDGSIAARSTSAAALLTCE